MSLPHFYLEEQVLADEGAEAFSLRLSRDDAKHARVLRLAVGEHVAVVDAARDYFECEIVSFDDAEPLVRIAQRFGAAETEPQVVLVQGLAKGDKMDEVIRHATELGVTTFVPLVCERSIVKLDAKKTAAKTERWRAIAKSAAMQSGRRFVPEVTEPAAIKDASASLADATAVLVCWEEAPGTAYLDEALAGALATADVAPDEACVAVVVGPEGGLTHAEVDALMTCNAHAALATLGPSILRTETAGVVAPALVLHELRRLARGAAQVEFAR
ncbi:MULTISPECIES: RsmE family RNA methyltransferase [Gordonibacter]|uniref:Ribosomal RNA small subunit methyltransferase E n=1 Tax=Gordonibacter faecis TaxID=3047475 RepID=A0ABT7DJ59_9ACTN|nr:MULTISPECIES: RsmE family RNA methyltransferase [unclassified Gordonibacter]MDJ1649292.1 RsmE family RNA methyltransferase [Gordonibacter sp. KGMB12511]HIW75241.1 16S rRNA (uracil(1498)-N(3))-methyltransferase [Candidatus Gordonibacter avicola]